MTELQMSAGTQKADPAGKQDGPPTMQLPRSEGSNRKKKYALNDSPAITDMLRTFPPSSHRGGRQDIRVGPPLGLVWSTSNADRIS